jgi:rhamnogalacturonyl hydrolase YesR
VGSYDHLTGETQISTLRSGFQKNDHANPSLCVGPDGRLTAYYSAHRGDRIYFRQTMNPDDVSAWGGEQMAGAWIDGMGGYTYPSVVAPRTDDAGRMLFFRGPSYQPSVLTVDEGGAWDRGRVLIQGRGERPYFKVETDGHGSTHIAFTDGHPRLEPENSVRYVRFSSDGFYRADGTKVADADAAPLDWQSADVVYDGGSGSGRAWVWDIALDEHGWPVIVYAVFPEEDDHRYRYARWNGEEWFSKELTDAGAWFPGAREGDDRFEPHYSGGIALDHEDPDVVYLSRPVDGVFEIERWETRDSGLTWLTTSVTTGSREDNVRPLVPRGRLGDGPQVLWMRGKYESYADFSTSIVGLVEEPRGGTSTDDVMKRAFDWQIRRFEERGAEPEPSWIESVFMIGVMEAYFATGDTDYLDAATRWAESNEWSPGPRLRHADDQCCSQVYLALWSIEKDERMLTPTIESFAPLVDDPARGRTLWSWCDALFMAPPAMSALSAATGEPAYLNTMDDMWWDTHALLYDSADSLFHRDEPSMTRRDGRAPRSWLDNRLFWSRGNGWVLAGTARVLEFMPDDYRSREEYEALLGQMAIRIAGRQGNDGLWRASLLDPPEVYTPETSGSALFCYAISWGINNGVLDDERFLPVVDRAWDGLVAAVAEDGRLGWVQGIGKGPALARERDTAPYGVGALLMAGSQMLRLERGEH